MVVDQYRSVGRPSRKITGQERQNRARNALKIDRIVKEDASFSLREARIGIVADVGALQRLPHIIGLANTKRMAYTGRFFSAEEVQQMGLVVEICPDQESMLVAVGRLAGEIKKCAPLAVQNTKEVLNYGRSASIREGINMVVHKNMLLLATKDCCESFAAFMEKHKPDFKGK